MTDQPASASVPVLEFHRHFGLPARSTPVDRLPQTEVDLRRRLLTEEYREYLAAADTGDVVSVADALADMVYVIYGTALHYGIDLDAVVVEVHRSNMTKTGHDGGKAVKGPGYQPPEIAAVLDAQRTAAEAGR
jgi:predicted HAD superfamily Cof-like phosphohydrolase